MARITNTSFVTDYSGEPTVTTYSNPVTTVINPTPPKPDCCCRCYCYCRCCYDYCRRCNCRRGCPCNRCR